MFRPYLVILRRLFICWIVCNSEVTYIRLEQQHTNGAYKNNNDKDNTSMFMGDKQKKTRNTDEAKKRWRKET
jgi:hypothetical protein